MGALLSATETFAGTMDAVGCAEIAKVLDTPVLMSCTTVYEKFAKRNRNMSADTFSFEIKLKHGWCDVSLLCIGGEMCATDNRCYPDPCTPQCDRRECGADGCGGSCGVCSTGARCVGEGFQLIDDETDPNNGEVVSSECFVFPVRIINRL
jgi:hypothetical protein